MHFLDIINCPVAGPRCSYQVMCSITYICKRNASFCQRGRRRPPFCLQIQEELLHMMHKWNSCHANPLFSGWHPWQGFSAITEVPAQVNYASVRLTKRTFHQTKAGEMISFSTRLPVTQHQLASITTTETIIFRFFLPFIFRSASPCSLFGLFAFFFWGISGRILKE